MNCFVGSWAFPHLFLGIPCFVLSQNIQLVVHLPGPWYVYPRQRGISMLSTSENECLLLKHCINFITTWTFLGSVQSSNNTIQVTNCLSYLDPKRAHSDGEMFLNCYKNTKICQQSIYITVQPVSSGKIGGQTIPGAKLFLSCTLQTVIHTHHFHDLFHLPLSQEAYSRFCSTLFNGSKSKSARL